jgi:HAD superfamily hydrolase (TIGR01549 family)
MILPKAILFDMDGTLTEERIDWSHLRAELKVGPTEGFLEAMERMTPDERAHVEQVLHDHESDAAARSQLNTGCSALLHWLDTRRIGRALITRNTRKSVQTVFDLHGLHFDVAITREDGKFKPDPTPLLLACDKLGVSKDQTWMVGDWKYDIEAANAARMTGVWLSYGRERSFEAVPDIVVHDLCELWDMLKRLADERVS